MLKSCRATPSILLIKLRLLNEVVGQLHDKKNIMPCSKVQPTTHHGLQLAPTVLQLPP